MFFARRKQPWTAVRFSGKLQGLGDIRAEEFGEGASYDAFLSNTNLQCAGMADDLRTWQRK